MRYLAVLLTVLTVLAADRLPPLPNLTTTSTNLTTSTNPPLPGASNVVISFDPNKIASIQVSNDLSNWFDFTNGLSPIIVKNDTNQAFFRGWYLGDALHMYWGALPTNYSKPKQIGIWVPTGWTCVWSTTNTAATNGLVLITNSLPNGFELFVAGMSDGTNWWPYTRASQNFYTLAGVPNIGVKLSITNQ